MPFSTAGAHRARRRRRSQRQRRNVSFPRSRHSLRHHQLRDQPSADVEDCFDLCQTRGLHLDPDTRISAAVGSSGNRFSILETVELGSSPSTETPPQCDFSFSKPLPKFDPQVCHAANDSPRSRSSQRSKITGGSSEPTCDEGAFNSSLTSIPRTPPSLPRVRLPGSYPSESEHANPQPQPTSLQDFTIPSPLLYHKSSREQLFGPQEDNHSSSSLRFLPLSGRDPPDSDTDFGSFKLGSPLQPPCDTRETQSSNAAELSTFSQEDISLDHDLTFYQCTRTCLPFPSEWNERCAVTVDPQTEHPIVTTTNTLRKRQTHVYPEDVALTPPPTPPSTTRITGRTVPATNEQIDLVTATVVNEYDWRACKNRFDVNAPLPSTPSRSYEEPSHRFSIGTINNESNERTKRRRTEPSLHSSHAQEVSPKGDHTSAALWKPDRARSDEMSAHDLKAEPQLSSPKVKEWSEKVPVSNDNSHSRSQSKLNLLRSRKLSKTGTDYGTSRFHNSHTIRIDPPRATATSTQSSLPLPLPTATDLALQPSPAVNPPPNFPNHSPHTIDTYPTLFQDFDTIEIQVCPTSACTALLLIAPTPKKLDLYWERLMSLRSTAGTGQDELIRKGEFIERMRRRTAEDLGLEFEHGQDCDFGVGVVFQGGEVQGGLEAMKKKKKMNDDTEADTGLHLRGGASAGGKGSKDDDGKQGNGGFASAQGGEEEVVVVDEESDEWEDSWVGEGEGLEFWV